MLSDLTLTFSIAGGLAVLVALVWLRRDRTTLPFLATFAVVLVLAYSWVVHFPLSYVRMAYYVPLALVPLVAFVLTRVPRRGLAALAGLALTVAIAVPAWGQARDVHRFYDFANPTTLRGLDAVSAQLKPGDVVASKIIQRSATPLIRPRVCRRKPGPPKLSCRRMSIERLPQPIPTFLPSRSPLRDSRNAPWPIG